MAASNTEGEKENNASHYELVQVLDSTDSDGTTIEVIYSDESEKESGDKGVIKCLTPKLNESGGNVVELPCPAPTVGMTFNSWESAQKY
ncbi:hypothetical protein Scep_014988 [Stephania cephalantha]|uniref:Uncharacterized protein n=1 Tax=Stephania cephalantha TaxID=152367 RepID=A0AAP0NZY1_9MAGN